MLTCVHQALTLAAGCREIYVRHCHSINKDLGTGGCCGELQFFGDSMPPIKLLLCIRDCVCVGNLKNTSRNLPVHAPIARSGNLYDFWIKRWDCIICFHDIKGRRRNCSKGVWKLRELESRSKDNWRCGCSNKVWDPVRCTNLPPTIKWVGACMCTCVAVVGERE